MPSGTRTLATECRAPLKWPMDSRPLSAPAYEYHHHQMLAQETCLSVREKTRAKKLTQTIYRYKEQGTGMWHQNLN